MLLRWLMELGVIKLLALDDRPDMSPFTVGLLLTAPGCWYGFWPATSFSPARPIGPSC